MNEMLRNELKHRRRWQYPMCTKQTIQLEGSCKKIRSWRVNISFAAGNDTLQAFLVRPSGPEKYPALVAIHEIFGLNENTREIARRLASEGYACLAVDLFSIGNKLHCIYQTVAAALGKENDNIATRRLKHALDYLATLDFVDATRLGAIGFCMGGNFAISLSCEDRRLKTIAPFYATNPNLEKAGKLCPVVGSYPGRDFTQSAGKELEKVLEQNNIPHDIKIYDRGMHSFMSSFYDHEIAEDAWKRTLLIFRKTS